MHLATEHLSVDIQFPWQWFGRVPWECKNDGIKCFNQHIYIRSRLSYQFIIWRADLAITNKDFRGGRIRCDLSILCEVLMDLLVVVLFYWSVIQEMYIYVYVLNLAGIVENNINIQIIQIYCYLRIAQQIGYRKKHIQIILEWSAQLKWSAQPGWCTYSFFSALSIFLAYNRSSRWVLFDLGACLSKSRRGEKIIYRVISPHFQIH